MNENSADEMSGQRGWGGQFPIILICLSVCGFIAARFGLGGEGHWENLEICARITKFWRKNWARKSGKLVISEKLCLKRNFARN